MDTKEARKAEALRILQESLLEREEEWRDVIGYEEQFEVSNLGRVRTKPKIIGWAGANGYMAVMFPDPIGKYYGNQKAGKKKNIHKLVMEAFVGPCPDKLVVNHLDGNSFNNLLENLEYTTNSENIKHGHRVGRNRADRGHILTEKEKVLILDMFDSGISRVKIARTFNVSIESIRYYINKRKNGIVTKVQRGRRDRENAG